MTTLLQRCQAWLEAPVSDGDPAADLADFVRSEIGRAADARLNATEPLVLYFANEEDRAGFVAIMTEAKPGMIARKWP